MSAPQTHVPDEPTLDDVASPKKSAAFPLIAGIALLVGAGVLSLGVLSGGGGGAQSARSAGGWGGGGPGGPGAGGAAAVRVTLAEKGALSKERRLPGEIVADRRAALHAEVGGQIASLPKRLGESVKQGELLLVLDAGALPAELKRAEAAAEVARARAERARIVLEQRRRDVERREGLAKEGAVSASELDATRTELKTAEVDLALADAEARRADADTEALRVRIAQTRVRAPFDGHIAAAHVDAGTIVAPGRLLLEVVSGGAPLVRFSIGEGDATSVVRGEKVKVTTAIGQHVAEVLRIGAAIDPESRTLPVEARLIPPEGGTPANDALPGMFVEVILEASAPADAVVVPVAALRGKGAMRTAFVDEDGVAKVRKVRVLLDDGKLAAVSGLAEGERVVVAGGDGVREGQKLEIVK